MGIGYIYPQFEVVRDWDKCTNCRICERQCAYGAHIFDDKKGRMVCDDSKCVDCQRCVCFCPTHALKIKKSDCVFRENANWDEEIGSPSSRDIFRQLAKEAEMVFVFEGAREENGVLTYRKGAADGKIEVTGKESHAGLKYTEGSSATVELAHQILQLTAMSDPEKEMYYNVGPLTGGTGTCVVAGHASAGIAVSPPDSASYEKICADMRKLEENVTVKGCTVKAHMDLIFPSMERTEGNVLVYQLVHEAGTLMGLDLPEQASGGSSDACYFTTYGAPTVDGLGPYLHDIHTFNERLDIASIQEKTQLFATVLGLLGEQ